MNQSLPHSPALELVLQRGVLDITINRPQARNALSDALVQDLTSLLIHLQMRTDIRLVTLRGAQGTFCAGGDLRDFSQHATKSPAANDTTTDAIVATNRQFGALLEHLSTLPQVTLAIVEGACFGGGVGLVAACDIAIGTTDSQYALSETTLGLIPAQIAPFLVGRLGLRACQRIALTGERFDGRRAATLGLLSEACENEAVLQAAYDRIVRQVLRCAPQANAVTKQLLLASDDFAIAPLLDRGAIQFAAALRGNEGQEGVQAFFEHRKPNWSADQ